MRFAGWLSLLLLGWWARRLLRLRSSVRRYAEHWSGPVGAAGGLVYAALGDSAAQGIGASRPERGYVGQLADRLRASTSAPVRVVNLSSSGAVLADVLADQLPALAALSPAPDVVTVAVGGNDLRHYDRHDFAVQAEQLAAALPSGAYLADAPYFMHGIAEEQALEASAVLRSAAQRHGLHAVGLHEAQRVQGWSAMFRLFAADWFHPNDGGHRVWADAFWSQLGRRFHEPREDAPR